MSARTSNALDAGLVLGIESSCDETAAAVVRRGREILSSVVESQAPLHAEFGGVVPEIAGRSHLRAILPVIDAALSQAQVGLDQLSAIAVTTQPGLIGSLLVGLSAAKGLSFARGLPLVPVDHIEAHVYAAAMELEREPFPCVALVVSGGHTALYHARSPLAIERICATLDDAAGEAFDKVAYLLGLGYPGGPQIARLAEHGDPRRFEFPRYRPRTTRGAPPPRFPPFSFSGLKTAVLYHLRGQNAAAPLPPPEQIPEREHVAASFEQAVVDALVAPTLAAARELQVSTVLVGGGVACNRRLRTCLTAAAQTAGIRAHFPSPAYCTDNAAMIAALGWRRFEAGLVAGLDADARPN